MTKELVKAYKQAWREANKEKIREYNKAYREAHPDRVKAFKTAWRKNNCEKRNQIQRVWRKANPEKGRDDNRKYRALKRTTQVERINEKVVYLRDDWKCQYCKKRVNKGLKWPHPMCASLDHIIPLSKGGAHIYSNVQLTHLSCNASKQNNALPQGEQLRIF